MSFRRSIVIWVSSGFFLVLAGYFFYDYFATGDDGQSGNRRGTQPAVVTAATAEQQYWRSQLRSVGTVQAIQGIDVTTEVAGKVAEIDFNAGANVEKDDLLVKLDTSTEYAELRSLEAQLEKARSDEHRARQLVDRGFISEAALQQTTTDTKNLKAQVEEQRAHISKKTIRAPFAGKLGIRQISPGELISPGTPIVTLQSISPIFVNFTLPEHTFAKVYPGQTVEVLVAAYPTQIFKGKISAINPKVSEKTRNFAVQALLPNNETHLQPGMFADVTIDMGTQRPVVAIPASAVTFNAYGETVFFVRQSAQQTGLSSIGTAVAPASADRNQSQDSALAQKYPSALIAERGFIKTGEKRGLMVEVVKGVGAGDRVVTAGQIKIDEGASIIISDDDVLRAAEPRPVKP
ncbi:membrane fusion protein, multidrug efflux system [Nitrosomonas sp. Nm51]|uniref:efflux RND transporter periplasmic adaptor subunit n=1 Tax=Nitrosomonas sp. Nm51 TaxID=133720 RepID=UPI0008D590A3|nr:efflux RND transporter periplasmic adaptor subunit [Nitrosomonas sp. Nm51]SER81371.1 membrane fusion protein, multidrug efflux system [Nitrosomonas sp. Nm51]